MLADPLPLRSAVRGLENIHILPLPPLLALRFIELVMHFGADREPWLIENLSRLLPSVPATLEVLTITYPTIYSFFRGPCVLQRDTMAALDSMIADCAPPLRIRWRLDFEDDDVQLVAEFTASAQLGLPRLHTKGRLIVVGYSFWDELREWNGTGSVSRHALHLQDLQWLSLRRRYGKDVNSWCRV